MSRIIILAAGKGTRMKSSLPKALVLLKGKPMIRHLLEAVSKSKVDSRPIIIVSPENKDLIKEALHDFELEFVIQKEQLGTGHAVACAKDSLAVDGKRVMIFNGDHPFVSADTIVELNESAKGKITLLTVKLDNFEGWKNSFYHWGRIVREGEKISSIIEFKDAGEKAQALKEVNAAMYSFDGAWLWENIKKIDTNNNQKEYYLTDLVHLAAESGKEIYSLPIEPREAMGINSLEELKIAEQIWTER